MVKFFVILISLCIQIGLSACVGFLLSTLLLPQIPWYILAGGVMGVFYLFGMLSNRIIMLKSANAGPSTTVMNQTIAEVECAFCNIVNDVELFGIEGNTFTCKSCGQDNELLITCKASRKNNNVKNRNMSDIFGNIDNKNE